jgi:molybdate transport system ATP-binding protein
MELEVSIRKKLREFTLNGDISVGRECLGLMGPSGSGKSMLLKCIAGIETPDEGRIVLNGNVLYDSEDKICVAPQKRKIGYLFQGYALFPNMTVEQNIRTGLKAKKLPETEVQKHTEKMMKIFQIENLKKAYPRQLSGGQKQRVALARLFAYEPDVILLDEPFAALDEELKEQLQEELKSLLECFHKPVIFVSHNPEEIRKICSGSKRIYEGEIQRRNE